MGVKESMSDSVQNYFFCIHFIKSLKDLCSFLFRLIYTDIHGYSIWFPLMERGRLYAIISER